MESESSQPLVSMLIPSFNHAQYVKACIESIIAQDYRNIELIIIDDGSADCSVEEIERLVPACADRFPRFEFRSRPNKGLAATINEALEWARGKYFAAIASDDLLHPTKTSSLLAHIDPDENIAGVFSGCEYINQTGSVVGRLTPLPAYITFDDIITLKHSVVASSQLLRLKSVKEVGCYLVGLYIEDWYMWLSLTKGGYKLKVVPDILVQYRQHESNISKNALKMFESSKWILGVFKDHPLYMLSMAQIYILAAINFSCISKRQSAGYLIEAVIYKHSIVFTLPFMSGVARLFVPCFVLKTFWRAKAWCHINIIGVRHSW